MVAINLLSELYTRSSTYSGIRRSCSKLTGTRELDQAELFATKATHIDQHIPGVNEILGIIYQNKKIPTGVESYQKELDINPQSNTSPLI